MIFDIFQAASLSKTLELMNADGLWRARHSV